MNILLQTEELLGMSIYTSTIIVAIFIAILFSCSGRGRNLEPPPAAPPPKKAVQLGNITKDELSKYDGTQPEMPLLMAIKGIVYDVSRSREFYGPGGPYALFAGRDASRALAKMSFEVADIENSDIMDLSKYEKSVLDDWESKFTFKYEDVGKVVDTNVSES